MQREQIYQLLKQKYGFDEFRPGQYEVISQLLAGQDVLAVLPTGTGKSLIYQLVGTIMPGLVVVVSPLISLMQDQVARLNYQGEKQVAALTSQLSFGTRQQVLRHLNAYKFLFVSPEMLKQPEVLAAVQATPIALFVVDEAHCISTWGPDFRPDYLALGQLREQLQPQRTLMLTATATTQVRQDILAQLRLPAAQQVVYSANRPNIYLGVAAVANEDEKRQMLQQLVVTVKGPTIVYFSSKRQTDLIAEWLQSTTGLRVAGYHAGLSGEDRFKIQQQFMAGQLDVICATSAFGMGIDKADIRLVIHYHLPTSLADYVQEIGRAGRDGGQSLAVLLYAPGDEQLVRNLNDLTSASANEITQAFQLYQQNITPHDDLGQVLQFYWEHDYTVEQVTKIFEKRQRGKNDELRQLLAYVQAEGCRRAVLLAHFDEPAPTHTNECCQLKGDSLPVAALNLQAPLRAQTPPNPAWESILDQLFLQNS
ncbi:RecQ family ATP-dependent DNA helicase [Lactiplantibacillus fabifermentans]|uniref:ATP-dependent DNA helicase RecQ n=2 Tax=Lactiplantibacillus fabifermentans TaxID=483011 RepID=A0A0R2ND01_9LACO|nr:RecQ family ATP-dependent DNA helicase [Lactiplantibacillus fabifermentans]ETY74240.1 ATP-dependent DNA helicase RecQ [Lactiplantibacillus fabifermentans T30PCM01]KRO23718.1 ATP-dependent DNA helicase RecQ [Lactiplantibacillus fabifermentans DSM 21115]